MRDLTTFVDPGDDPAGPRYDIHALRVGLCWLGKWIGDVTAVSILEGMGYHQIQEIPASDRWRVVDVMRERVPAREREFFDDIVQPAE